MLHNLFYRNIKILLWSVWIVPAVVSCGDEDIPSPETIFSASTSVMLPDSSAIQLNNIRIENEDCGLCRLSAEGDTIWKRVYERTSFNCAAELISLLDTNLIAIFSIDGFNFSKENFTRLETKSNAFDSVLFSSYGLGIEMNRVSIITRIDHEDGKVLKGTYFMSRTTDGNINNNGKTNSLKISTLGQEKDRIIFIAEADSFPPSPVSLYNDFSTFTPEELGGNLNHHWRLRYEISTDFDQILVAFPLGNN